jgi:hypothetical protein
MQVKPNNLTTNECSSYTCKPRSKHGNEYMMNEFFSFIQCMDEKHKLSFHVSSI